MSIENLRTLNSSSLSGSDISTSEDSLPSSPLLVPAVPPTSGTPTNKFNMRTASSGLCHILQLQPSQKS